MFGPNISDESFNFNKAFPQTFTFSFIQGNIQLVGGGDYQPKSSNIQIRGGYPALGGYQALWKDI